MTGHLIKTSARTLRTPCPHGCLASTYSGTLDSEGVRIDHNEVTRAILPGHTVPIEHLHDCT